MSEQTGPVSFLSKKVSEDEQKERKRDVIYAKNKLYKLFHEKTKPEGGA